MPYERDTEEESAVSASFPELFGPRPIWYVQALGRDNVMRHYRFSSWAQVDAWIRRNTEIDGPIEGELPVGLYFQVQGSAKVVDTRPVKEEIDTLFAFPIDIDPVGETRPASEAERKPCFEVAAKISARLVHEGFDTPTIVSSGNGAQVFIRFPAVKASPEWADYFKRMEQWVKREFNDPRVKLDSVADFSRVMALPGSLKMKLKGVGNFSAERPFRQVEILEPGEVTDPALFEIFASRLPVVKELVTEEFEDLVEEEPTQEMLDSIPETVREEFYTKGDDDSAAEFAFAVHLAQQGWNPGQIYYMLQKSDIRAPNDPKRGRKGYYMTTIGRAMVAAQEYLEVQKATKKTPVKEKDKPKPVKGTNPNPADESWLKYLNKGGGIKVIELANDISAIMHTVGVWSADRKLGLYAYEGGVFVPAEMKVRKLVRDLLGPFARQKHVSEVIAHLEESSIAKLDWFDKDEWVLNLRNGLFDMRTKKLVKHGPMPPKDFFSMKQLPVEYDPAAKCPSIDSYFSSWVKPNYINALYEVVAHCLVTWDYPIQQAVILEGHGQNGKTTFLQMVTGFLGTENVTAIEMQEFFENRFASAKLIGKYANICSDMDKRRMKSSADFKKLTGGDLISGENKNKPKFDFYNRAKMLFSLNELPPTPDDTDAFHRRIFRILFPFKFTRSTGRKRQSSILTDCQAEYPGLLNKCLEILPDLLERCVFTGDSEDIDGKRESYVRASRPVYAFWEDKLIYRQEALGIPQDILFKAFKDWCAEVNLDPPKYDGFYRRLKSEFQDRALSYEKYRPNKFGERWVKYLELKSENNEGESKTDESNDGQNERSHLSKPEDGSKDGSPIGTHENPGVSGLGATFLPISKPQSEIGPGMDGSSETENEKKVVSVDGYGKKDGGPETIHFDIEASGLDPQDPANVIRLIVAEDNDGYHYFDGNGDEGELLANFDGYLAGKLEGKVMGWNSWKYDLPLLEARYNVHLIPWSQTEISQMLHVDAMLAHEYLAKKNEPSYRLHDVSVHRLGHGKTDGGWRADMTMDELRTYCANDVHLVRELDQKFGYSMLIDSVVKLTDCDVHKWLMPENATSENPYRETVPIFALMQKHGVDLKWPNELEKRKRKAEGGASNTNTGGARFAEPGVYRNILGLDVSAMYPQLLVTFNMGRATWTDKPGAGIGAAVGGFHLPTVIESKEAKVVSDIMRKEKELKGLRKTDPENAPKYQAEIDALKVLRNSVYGVFYPIWSPLYKREIGLNITQLGQAVIQEAKRFLAGQGMHVVYIHTDSAYAAVAEGTDAQKVVESLNAHIAQWLKDTYHTPNPSIYFESKGVWPHLLLQDMGRYAYVDEKGTTIMVGYEKGNFSEMKRKIQRHIIDSIIAGRKPEPESVKWEDRDAINYIHVGNTSRNTAQATALRVLTKAGIAPSPGLPVGYVIIGTGKQERRVYFNQETEKWVDSKGLYGEKTFLSDEERKWIYQKTISLVDTFQPKPKQEKLDG